MVACCVRRLRLLHPHFSPLSAIDVIFLPDLCAVGSAAGQGLNGGEKRRGEDAHLNFLRVTANQFAPQEAFRVYCSPFGAVPTRALRACGSGALSGDPALHRKSERRWIMVGALCSMFIPQAQRASPYIHQNSDSPPTGWTHLWGRIVIESLSDDHKQLKVPCSVVRPIIITQKPCPPPLKEAT